MTKQSQLSSSFTSILCFVQQLKTIAMDTLAKTAHISITTHSNYMIKTPSESRDEVLYSIPLT
jgi:hypothetical protein